MKTTYEWDIETIDENGDITDHHHEDKIASFSKSDLRAALDEKGMSLCLIRDESNESGSQCRSWAYVKNGQLEAEMKEAGGPVTCKVPERFMIEFEKMQENKVAA